MRRSLSAISLQPCEPHRTRFTAEARLHGSDPQVAGGVQGGQAAEADPCRDALRAGIAPDDAGDQPIAARMGVSIGTIARHARRRG